MEKNYIKFEQIVERGCGMDVHKETIVATIQGKGIKTMTKSYKTYTTSLMKLKAWLKKHGVTHIVMESTGVYWKPVFNVLGEDFQILLVNARHVKNVPGNKTDKKDSKWLAKLLLSGLLQGSFIPSTEIRELRDLTRYRRRLKQFISSDKNRLLKILEDANIKLSIVLSDVFGATGQKLIKEILKEDYEPEKLLSLVHGRVKASRSDIKEALTGYVTPHHRFMLTKILLNIERVQQTVAEIEARINTVTEQYGDIIELLKGIPGVDYNGAIGIIAEISNDMSAFPTHKHIASWAGMSPGNNESAGKNKSGRITYGNKYLRALLVELGWAASRTKGTYLNAKYKSLVARRGKKKSIIAIGHKILIASYFIIRDKVPYNELGADYLNNFRKDKLIEYYSKQLEKLTASGSMSTDAA